MGQSGKKQDLTAPLSDLTYRGSTVTTSPTDFNDAAFGSNIQILSNGDRIMSRDILNNALPKPHSLPFNEPACLAQEQPKHSEYGLYQHDNQQKDAQSG